MVLTKKVLNYIEIISLVLILASLIYLVLELRTEGTKCMISPLTYGADSIKPEGYEIMCQCLTTSPLISPIFFNDTSITSISSSPQVIMPEL